ncbi:hypothetical protein [Streptomyces zagrosensis]|uniref:Toxin n=1 Tax=Streptomyces zagrosensis TaxID=1042984 RepID=A0A7W9QH89_9ACTN|nr:hypothetical protein [Streptomyces zagrosensis]MBB5939999.1 hypothetical protein [Streptomyces zagrosensis]
MLWSQKGPTRARVSRRECARVVAGMPLPVPFTLSGLIAEMEAARGRRICLVPLEEDAPGHVGACGLWLRHHRLPLDLILHVRGTSRFHRKKIILHELCHLWCEDGARGTDIDRLIKSFPGRGGELTRQLLASGQAQARGGYGTHVERRAELVADILHDLVRTPLSSSDPMTRALDLDLAHPHAVRAIGEGVAAGA